MQQWCVLHIWREISRRWKGLRGQLPTMMVLDLKHLTYEWKLKEMRFISWQDYEKYDCSFITIVSHVIGLIFSYWYWTAVRENETNQLGMVMFMFVGGWGTGLNLAVSLWCVWCNFMVILQFHPTKGSGVARVYVCDGQCSELIHGM